MEKSIGSRLTVLAYLMDDRLSKLMTTAFEMIQRLAEQTCGLNGFE